MEPSSEVSALMTRIVLKAHAEDTLLETARRMREFRVSGMPVVDSEDRLVGLVSEVDLVRDLDRSLGLLQPRGLLDLLLEARGKRGGSPLVAARQRLAHARVRDVMATKVVTVDPDDSVGETARLMQLHGINRVPVVDADRKVVGIVSHLDLLAAITGVPRRAHGRRVPKVAPPKAPVGATSSEFGLYGDI